ncbi:MAG: hypothetical protein KBA71_08185 [Opitutaceae bacterium]|nr:hypothetical protein [Opitutaceae bacterium]
MMPLFRTTHRPPSASRQTGSATWTRALILTVALLAAAGVRLPAQSRADRRSRSAASQPADPFDAFRTIGERNIFDPNRQPRIRRDSSTDVATPSDEVISFVGTLQYEKGLFAFFDGSDPRYRTTLPIGGGIAGFSITQIAPRSVSLSAKDRLLTLRMGESLRRREGSDWSVSMLAQPLGDAAATSAAAPSRPDPNVVPSDASATLRRLMEQRQKQLKE